MTSTWYCIVNDIFFLPFRYDNPVPKCFKGVGNIVEAMKNMVSRRHVADKSLGGDGAYIGPAWYCLVKNFLPCHFGTNTLFRNVFKSVENIVEGVGNISGPSQIISRPSHSGVPQGLLRIFKKACFFLISSWIENLNRPWYKYVLVVLQKKYIGVDIVISRPRRSHVQNSIPLSTVIIRFSCARLFFIVLMERKMSYYILRV